MADYEVLLGRDEYPAFGIAVLHPVITTAADETACSGIAFEIMDVVPRAGLSQRMGKRVLAPMVSAG